MSTKKIIGNYEELGYMGIKSFISKDTIDEMNNIIDNLDLKLSETVFDESKTGKIKQIQYLNTYNPLFQKVVDQLKNMAKKLVGDNQLEFLNMQLFEKHPKISKPTRAHQDNAYFKVAPANAITFWLALDDIDEENGCLYYAPKTHILPTSNHSRYHKSTTFRLRSGVPGLSLCLHEHPSELDTPMIVEKGDLLAHHCNLIHRAGKNDSKNRRRRAIGVVFIPKACKMDERLNKHHTDMLKEDIELQKVKDPLLYEELMSKYNYLFK